jgi:hypothetical protein
MKFSCHLLSPLLTEFVIVYLEEELPELSGVPEISLDPPFSKKEILSLILESIRKNSPPFEKGRMGAISGKPLQAGK